MSHPSTSMCSVRFFALCYSLALLDRISSFGLISSFSTVFYSILIPLIQPSHMGLIIHKSFSHVPSTILLVVAINSEFTYRLHLLSIAVIQYLGIWIEMYSEVITLQLKQELIDKQSPNFFKELLWAANDAFLILHLFKISDFSIGENSDLAYQVSFYLFIVKTALDLVFFGRNVLKIVDFDSRKVKTS